MDQTMNLAHGGWRPEEIDLLWKEIRAASETGAPLRDVFERMGETLGRKPNSVRNYYYMQLRDQAGEEFKRAAPFETFTDQEVHDLLREVLQARGRGESVRACVMALSGGNRTLMLRYQNKYRSILRRRPGLIEQVEQELRAEGLPCPEEDAPARAGAARSGGQQLSALRDPDARIVLAALESLSRRAEQGAVRERDRWKVEKDLLLMQAEDLQLAAKDLLAACKDFLGGTEEERQKGLAAFCDRLAGQVQRLESVCG